MDSRRFAFRISLAYFLLMLGSGAQLPFLPLWLKSKGIDVTGIAAISAGMMATRIIGAPLFAWIADHFGNRRLVVQLCAGFAFASYVVLTVTNGFWPITAVALVAAFMFAPVFPLTEALSVDGSAAHRLDYGRLRLWASLSFLVGSLMAGALLTQLEAGDAVVIITVAQGVSLLASFLLPQEPRQVRAVETGNELSRARQLFFGSSFPVLMIAAGLGQASHGMLYSLSSVHWTSLGISTLGVGFLWTVAVLAEVLLLAFSNAVVERLGPGRTLLVGLAGGLLRWVLMAFVVAFPPLLLVQVLHAFSFAMTHLGTMHLIRRLVPDHIRNRAQGINAAISGGILLSSATWFSGWLYAFAGGHAYLGMAAISLAASLTMLMLLRLSPRVQAAAAA